MPEIIVEETAQAPLEKVYAIAKDVERFPEWMDNVDTIEVVARAGNVVTSRWVGQVPEFKRTLRWTEEDAWDDAAHTCTFRATEGDWDTYEGTWEFIAEGEKTRMRLQLCYDFNVPLIGGLIKGLLKKLVTGNSRAMLTALAKRAEGEGEG